MRLSQEQIVFRVRDYGHGIPADVLNRFRQNRAHGGVGLAGMRERINELGGHLEMDSDGHGTQVLVIMPRRERHEAAKISASDSHF